MPPISSYSCKSISVINKGDRGPYLVDLLEVPKMFQNVLQYVWELKLRILANEPETTNNRPKCLPYFVEPCHENHDEKLPSQNVTNIETSDAESKHTHFPSICVYQYPSSTVAASEDRCNSATY